MATLAKPPKRGENQNGFPYSRLQRISVTQYHRMIASGALTENDPIELLEGWLVSKMPRDPQHDTCITKLQNRLIRMLPREWIVRVQCEVTTKDSEPEPDIAVVLGPEDRYETHHPKANDLGLVIEVANTSLDDDRIVKGRVYARAHFSTYWIVNLSLRQIEVYENPRGGRSAAYPEPKVYHEKDRIAVVLLGMTVGDFLVRDILPSK